MRRKCPRGPGEKKKRRDTGEKETANFIFLGTASLSHSITF